MSKKQFTEVYRDSLKQRLDSINFQLSDDSSITGITKGGDTMYISPDNAYIEYLVHPDSVAYLINKYIVALGDPLNKQDVNPSLIVPVVRSASMLDEMRLNYPGKPITWVYDKYNEDLLVFYVENLPGGISYLLQDKLTKTGIPRDSLRTLAMRNLIRTLPEIQKKGNNGLYMLIDDGNFESSLILLPYLFTKENLPVKGDYVVGIPTRDVLLVTGNADTGNIAKIKEICNNLFQKGDHAVSNDLYRWNGKLFIPIH